MLELIICACSATKSCHWLCVLQCSLACHKKCLETLAIQCGHKKLQGKLHLFGIDFSQAAKNSPDGIPFIIRKCTSEIENRALNIKVLLLTAVREEVHRSCWLKTFIV